MQRKALEVSLVLSLVSVLIVTIFRRYGVHAVLTGGMRRIKHAATGRATRRAKMHWLGAGHRLEGLRDSASIVTARLRAEREARMQRLAHAALAA